MLIQLSIVQCVKRLLKSVAHNERYTHFSVILLLGNIIIIYYPASQKLLYNLIGAFPVASFPISLSSFSIAYSMKCDRKAGGERLHGNEATYTYWSIESTDPKYNFNTYVTMEVNHEGSELPTLVLGLALRCSLNLTGSKSPDYSKTLVT